MILVWQAYLLLTGFALASAVLLDQYVKTSQVMYLMACFFTVGNAVITLREWM